MTKEQRHDRCLTRGLEWLGNWWTVSHRSAENEEASGRKKGALIGIDNPRLQRFGCDCRRSELC